ncbi:MAG: glycosyltransferase [Acidimicrobiales bacterium]|nr:glycosyltransferase [Acidimicrobiales bacterium]
MRLDIIIPAHNEAHRIDRTLTTFRSRIEDPAVRFLLALDRCTDGTEAVVDRHARVDSRIEIIRYPKLGKGGVIIESLRRCDAELVGFVDADCATPPVELLRLVEATSAADVAIASRWHPAAVLPGHRPLSRKLESRVFAGMVKALFGLPYMDTQCGAKILRRAAAQTVVPLLSSRDFLFDVDLLLASRKLGLRVVEVPTVWIDQAGSRVRPAQDGRRMALSALRLWLHSRVLPLPDTIDELLSLAGHSRDALASHTVDDRRTVDA